MKPDTDIVTQQDVITPQTVMLLAEYQKEQGEVDAVSFDEVRITQAFTRSIAPMAKERDAASEIYGVRINRHTDEATPLDLEDPEVRAMAAERVADIHRSGFGAAIFAEAALDDVSREQLRAIRAERARLWNEYGEPWNKETPPFEEIRRAVDAVMERTKNNPIWNAIETLTQRLIDTVGTYVDAVRAGGCPLATLTAHLRAIGEHGEAQAAAIEADTDYADNPTLVWFDEVVPGLCGYIQPLAQALWIDVVQPLMERAAKSERTPPTLTEPVFDGVARFTVHAKRKVVSNPNQLMLFVDGELMATAKETVVADAQVTEALAKTDGVLGKANGQRFLRWLVSVVTTQRIMSGVDPTIHDPATVDVEGGYRALAEAIGATYNTRVAKELRDILAAGSSWRLRIDGIEFGGLWTYRSDEATGQRQGHISIRAAEILDPAYQPRGSNIKVVLLPFDSNLSGITNDNNRAKLAAFRQGIVRFITERRKEYGEKGGVLITPQNFRNLAGDVGLSEAIAFNAVQAWCTDRPEGEALLSESGGRYSIAINETYKIEREYINETVAIAKSASVRGKRSAAKRATKTTKTRRIEK